MSPAALVGGRLLTKCVEKKLLFLSLCRPGYGSSDPLTPYSLQEYNRDVESILGMYGVETFVSVGYSGGGPFALSCGLLPACQAVHTISSFAPRGEMGDAFFEGMCASNVKEYQKAVAGEEQLRACLKGELPAIRLVCSLPLCLSVHLVKSDESLSQGDRAAITRRTYYRSFIRGLRHAVRTHGVEGWLRDDLVIVTDWGFKLRDLKVPVCINHGDQDKLVPVQHGQFLASSIPGAQLKMHNGCGHHLLSEEFIDELAQQIPAATI